jgi:hypothetical protein
LLLLLVATASAASPAQPTLPATARTPHLQRDPAHVWLCCDDLVLCWQLCVALVLEVTDRAAEVEVAVHAAHATNLTQEAACMKPCGKQQQQQQGCGAAQQDTHGVSE